MKKTNKVKMGPLGTPLGNPLGYFNSLKSKRTAEPKQTLKKAQDGIEMENDMMINKPGYGAKKTSNPLTPYAGIMNPPTDPYDIATLLRENANAANAVTSSPQGAVQAKAANMNIDALTNRSKSNTPILDSLYPSDEKLTGLTQEQLRARGLIKKTGGTHKMPNGKMMLNSAMKKKISKKK